MTDERTVEDYKSGEIKIKYSMINKTTVAPQHGESALVKFILTIFIDDNESLNVMRDIPRYLLEESTIEERIEHLSKSMIMEMACYIHEKMDIAGIYKKHIQAHESMSGGEQKCSQN